uniref:Pre-mRNA-splicing factor 38B isoform X2 n=1 Tax=Rhizophora mucronata TaxID=61149 RepID=A0A2P2II70_RHIMU
MAIETEKEIGIGTEVEYVTGTGIVTGRETEMGIGNGRGLETGGMIMIGGPGMLTGKAGEIMKGAHVMGADVMKKVDLVEAIAGVGAGVRLGAEVGAYKLAVHHLIATLVHIGMDPRRRLQHLAI